MMRFEVPVEIKATDVHEKRGTSRQGKLYLIREQSGYVELGKVYPVEVKVPLDDTAPPYEPGLYVVDPHCLHINLYGQLALGRLKLIRHSASK